MNHVGHRTVRHPDVGCDHGPAQAGRHQIPVFHPGAANDPGGLIGEPAHDKGMSGVGKDQRRVQFIDLDPRAVWGNKHPFAICEFIRRIGQDAQGAGAFRRAFFDPHPQPVTGKDRNLRIVSRIDHVQTHLERPGEEGQILGKIVGGQSHFGARFHHRGPISVVSFPAAVAVRVAFDWFVSCAACAAR